MLPTTVKALTMMGIALPVMFGVILVFIGITKVLHRSLPASAEADDED